MIVRKIGNLETAASWNRQTTQTLNETPDFQTFQEFAHFMSVEAKVACNPVTSFSCPSCFRMLQREKLFQGQ